MGIPAVPVEYGDDCLACYPAGKTPLKIWASVTGIKPGELEPVGGWHCPNGFFLLTQDEILPCKWSCESWPEICQLTLDTPWATFGLQDKNGQQAFYKQYFQACAWDFENAIDIWDDNFYYGGNCSLKACLDDEDTDLISVMKLLNIEPSAKLLCEFFPISDSQGIFKYCRKSDKTNISVKFSY